MGLTFGIQTITGEDIPLWFTKTDSKKFAGRISYLLLDDNDYEDLPKLLKRIGLELSSLKKIKDGSYRSFETFLVHFPFEERKNLWNEQETAEELLWQSPENIISDLDLLLDAINSSPGIFMQTDISDNYFLDGYFRQDIIDLQKMAKWAQEQGIEKVRLTIA